MIQTYFRPVLGHFMPINSSWLQNYIILVLFPNFCSHFSERYFVSTVIIEGNSIGRKLDKKNFTEIFNFALTC